MTRACPSILPLRLWLVCLLAVAPAFARAAEDPNDPNTPLPMGPTPPCFEVEKVVPGIAFGFQDPNDPNSVNWYSDLPDCTSTCKKAGSTCAKYVKRSVSCELTAINNRKTFNVKIQCDTLKGDALKTCTQQFVDVQTSDRAALNAAEATALSDCDAGAARCAEKCNAHP